MKNASDHQPTANETSVPPFSASLGESEGEASREPLVEPERTALLPIHLPVGASAAESDRAMRRSRHLQRLDHLVDTSLADPDPLTANLGVATAELLELSARFSDAIRDEVVWQPDVLKGSARLGRGLDALLKVNRQAERYAQLYHQRRPAKQAVAKPPEPQALLQVPDTCQELLQAGADACSTSQDREDQLGPPS